MSKMKQTAYWVDENLLKNVKERAEQEGTTASDITRRALEEYLKNKEAQNETKNTN